MYLLNSLPKFLCRPRKSEQMERVKQDKYLFMSIFAFLIQRHQVSTHFKLLSRQHAVQVSSDDACLKLLQQKSIHLAISSQKHLDKFAKQYQRYQLYSIYLDIHSS